LLPHILFILFTLAAAAQQPSKHSVVINRTRGHSSTTSTTSSDG
jgi:hypothetical protein